MPPMHRYLTSRNSSRPYLEPSRPIPDSLTPPNGAPAVMATTAEQHPGALVYRVRDVLLDLADGVLVDQRPDLDPRLEATAHLQPPHLRRELLREPFVHARL